MMRSTFSLLATLIVLGCGSSVKATGDAADDLGTDGSGDTSGEVPTDVPTDSGVDVTGDGADDPVPDATSEVPGECGDGSTDEGEECDDGNDVDGDGCDSDCTYSCHGPEDCADSDMCTEDLCTESHVCENPELDCGDGDPCTTDWCDAGEGCVNSPLPDWYRDADSDGYGDPHDHRCQESRPEGYVDNDDACCDSLVEVNPAQTSFFHVSYDCGGLTRSFDYNCDGTEERRWTTMGSCTRATDGTCVGVNGWMGGSGGGPPACGASGSWMGSCTSGGTGSMCIASGTSRTQECR